MRLLFSPVCGKKKGYSIATDFVGLGIVALIAFGLVVPAFSAEQFGGQEAQVLTVDEMEHELFENLWERSLDSRCRDCSPLLLLASTQALGLAPVKDSGPLNVGLTEPPSEKSEPIQIEPITRLVPIWGEDARKEGYDLPLPFGTGLNVVYLNQEVELDNIVLGRTPDPIGVKIRNTKVQDVNITFRQDVWLFPFLNLYGLLGYTSGHMNPTVDIPAINLEIDNPFPGLPPITIPISRAASVNPTIEYDGVTYGVGGTLAGGYQAFFGAVDLNYTYTNLDILDSTTKTLTVTPRVGLQMEDPNLLGVGTVWIGAMYMDFAQTLTATVNLREIDPLAATLAGTDELQIKIDQKAKHPWNMLIGGSWNPGQRWDLVLEVGFLQRLQALMSINYRY